MLVVVLMISSSCNKCRKVTCLYGYCDRKEGVCVCPEHYYGEMCEVYCLHGTGSSSGCTCDDGYTGDNCDREWREKIVGMYDTYSRCEGDTAWANVGTSTVYKSGTEPKRVVISPFGGWLCAQRPVGVSALMTSLSSLVLYPSPQYICDSLVEVRAGSQEGIISSAGEISLVYRYLQPTQIGDTVDRFCEVRMRPL